MRRTFAATAACVLVLAGCGDTDNDHSGTFYGPSQNLGNGTVKTYVTLDASGNPTEVGLRMSESALDGLPATDPAPRQPLTLHLAFPDQAKATLFDHVMVNWNAQGHEPPPLFGKPHFDFHFSMADMPARQTINPANPNFAEQAAKAPAAQYIPQDYVTVPDSAVPFMGVHWVDKTEQLVPGQYDFKQIMINGSWDGRYTFLEPMITREWLLTKPALDTSIKQPQAFQKTGYFPSTYVVRFDSSAKDYVIGLGAMTKREAS